MSGVAIRLQGHHRNLLVSATGTGKTVMAALDYVSLREALPRARLLFVAHREEILTQSQATFRQTLRDPIFGELWVGGSVRRTSSTLTTSGACARWVSASASSMPGSWRAYSRPPVSRPLPSGPDTPETERRQALKGLADRRINVVFSVDLFNERIDVPAVDTLLLLRPTDSAMLFLQQLGRGL
jgi:superfamily II DNA or RNA helicase